MGELIFTDDFISKRKDATWYFSRGIYDPNDWEKLLLVDYPERVAIHRRFIVEWSANEHACKRAIRRFINQNCDDVVICHVRDMSYAYLHRYDNDRKAYREKISHGYYLFFFENTGDAVKFAINFSDIVSEIADRHPEYTHVSEEEIADAANNPYGIFQER